MDERSGSGDARDPVGHTAGGRKLRALRRAAGISLFDLVGRLPEDATIDATHISRIETGETRKPRAQTLEAILAGLGAGYRDRRDVLEAFGYHVPRTLPTEPEIAEARELCAHELNDATYPVHLTDNGQRIHAWNRYAPRMLGLSPDGPEQERFRGVTIFDVALDPSYGARPLIDNPEEYVPAMVRFVKPLIESYRGERWYDDLMARASRLPGFSTLWDAADPDPVRRYALQPIVPIRMNVPGVGMPLRFRLSSAEFFVDPRFQIVHWTPFGAVTLRECAVWAEEEGVQ